MIDHKINYKNLRDDAAGNIIATNELYGVAN